MPEAGERSFGVRRLHSGDLPHVRHAARVGRRTGCGLIACLLVVAGCGARQEQKAVGYAYTGPATLNLRSDLGLRALTTATVEHGDRLQILESKRKFVRVRTTKGVEGWTDSTLLLTQTQMDQLQALAKRAEEAPSQALGTVFDTLNLHSGPSRTAPSFGQIQEDEKIDVVARRVTPREGYSPDDWFLIRDKKGRAGWVLSRGILMLIPDEVTQYASGAFIMGYMSLGESRDAETGDVKPNWLWTTAAHAHESFDYDTLRLFVWNNRRKAYDTGFAERNIHGYYPVEKVALPDQPGEAFTAVVEDKDGGLFKRTYVYNDRRVKLLRKEPYQFPPPLPEVSEVKEFDKKDPAAPKPLADRIRDYAKWWLGI